LTDPAKKNLSDFYKSLLFKIENEIQRLNEEAKPNEEEIKLQDNINKNPSDLESRYNLAKIQWEKNKSQQAIDTCLEIVKIDRNWNNKAAYTLLIEIFNKLGSSNEIVMKARK
jgi:putative thioredoxin